MQFQLLDYMYMYENMQPFRANDRLKKFDDGTRQIRQDQPILNHLPRRQR